MNIEDFLKKHIIENGYVGLINNEVLPEGEICACVVGENFLNCLSDFSTCHFAKEIKCDNCGETTLYPAGEFNPQTVLAGCECRNED